MGGEIQIQLLGSLKVTRDAQRVDDFISTKAPALLAYLAVTRRAHSRESLAALLWGEMAEADAKNNLRQTLSNLRRVVGDTLEITRDSVELRAAGILDVTRFEQDALSTSEEQLTRALGLYQGDFLEGLLLRDAPEYETWMLSERMRLRELAMRALLFLTERHAARGQYSAAMDYATRLLACDPWREETHRQLILLQARSGQWSAALAQYESCRRTLESELGVEPSAETIALYERIRSARQRPRHNLPGETSPFIGREAELQTLRERLNHPACRLVTLSGLGGAGKTRLALQTAASCLDLFINGAWFVPLAASQPAGILPAIAEALDFTFSSGDHKKQLLNYLRQKELLLVLDNFEHLLEEAPLLADLLRAAPQIKLLVTSRERLDIQDEWVLDLGGLSLPPLGSSPSSQPEQPADALRLFYASALRAGGVLADEDGAAAAEICRVLGGLPLGIEIAAAWTRTLRPAAIQAKIQADLDFLASTHRDQPPRQRSLRAVFESVWSRLAEPEQSILAQLSVFRAGFEIEAAHQVCGATEKWLHGLVEKSLLQLRSGRFELHEVIRQFSQEKLSAEEPVCDAHCRYYAGFVGALGSAKETASFPRMHLEFENIRTAWSWAVGRQDIPSLAGMAPFLKRYLDVQGRYREGLGWFQAALEGLGHSQDLASLTLDPRGHLIARLTLYQNLFAADAGRSEQSLQSLQACLEYFRRAQDEEQIMVCLNALGIAYCFLGQYTAAVSAFREDLNIARRTGNRFEEAVALNNMTRAFNTSEQFDEAEKLYRQCLALRRELGDEAGVASTLINLGVALFNQGRYAEAKPLLDEVIAISKRIHHPRNLAAALGNLGGIFMREGRYAEAFDLFRQGLEIHRNTGYRYGLAIALDNVGTACFWLGNEVDAFYYLRQSLRESQEIKADFIALDALVGIAGLRARRGELEKAVEILEMVAHHPATDAETQLSIETLLPGLEARMPAETVRMTRMRGQQKELIETIAEQL